jgi:hypothetical protein
MAIEQDGAIKGQQDLWALAAGAPLPLHPLSTKPQENEAIPGPDSTASKSGETVLTRGLA